MHLTEHQDTWGKTDGTGEIDEVLVETLAPLCQMQWAENEDVF